MLISTSLGTSINVNTLLASPISESSESDLPRPYMVRLERLKNNLKDGLYMTDGGMSF